MAEAIARKEMQMRGSAQGTYLCLTSYRERYF